MANRQWMQRRDGQIELGAILQRAAAIVRTYDTGVTFKQLFYQLVADRTLQSTESDLVQLSSKSAEARRAGVFPDLIDQLHRVHEYEMWADVPTAVEWLRRQYWRDRTEGQRVSLYIGLEKAGMVEQCMSWFADRGIVVVAISGWGGQGYIDDIVRHVRRRQRPAVLLYGGDFNPDGIGIERDFIKRTNCWTKTLRVVLTLDQIKAFKLPRRPGKNGATRNKAFAEEFGKVFSVDMDALKPEVLRSLFEAAVREYWDEAAYQKVLRREQRDRILLHKLGANGSTNGRGKR